jgi:putative component of membrane protein insertase Oxa1/YidC/SpoIIIJ protein YidD
MKQLLLLCLLIPGFLFSCAHPQTTGEESNSAFNPMRSVVEFYQGPLNHLSAVKKAECPMYPSCSEYSIQCFDKHGLLIGWVMTHDRLMRCGRDELKLSPTAIVNGKWKCIDPVGNNDFWWYENMHKKVSPQ